MTPTDLIGVTEVAGLTGYSVSKVKRLARSGKLPTALKMPGGTGAYLFERATVQQFAEANSVGAAIANGALATIVILDNPSDAA